MKYNLLQEDLRYIIHSMIIGRITWISWIKEWIMAELRMDKINACGWIENALMKMRMDRLRMDY